LICDKMVREKNRVGRKKGQQVGKKKSAIRRRVAFREQSTTTPIIWPAQRRRL